MEFFMKRFLLSILLSIMFSCTTDEAGVKFEYLTYSETLAKAFAENKMIMVDVFSYG